MNFARERWVKYFKEPLPRETLLGPLGSVLLPEFLKLAAPARGEIPLPCGIARERHLFRVLGGRAQSDDRLIAGAIDDLLGAGVMQDPGPGSLVFPDWAQTQSKKPGTREAQPFFRLYTRERGSYRQLAPVVRGLGAVLLRLVDDSGRLHNVWGESWDRVVLTMLGWRREARWWLRGGLVERWLGELVDDGYLVKGVGPNGREYLEIANFLRAQCMDDEDARAPRAALALVPTFQQVDKPVEKEAVAARDGRESGASLAPAWRESGVGLARVGSEKLAKSAESPKVAMSDRSDRYDRREIGDGFSAGPENPGPLDQAVRERPAARRRPADTLAPTPSFVRCWTKYPARNGVKAHKQRACAMWRKLARELGEDVLEAQVVAALEWQVRLAEWKRGIGVADFAVYLREKRFDPSIFPKPSDPAAFRDGPPPRARDPRAPDPEAERQRMEARAAIERKALAEREALDAELRAKRREWAPPGLSPNPAQEIARKPPNPAPLLDLAQRMRAQAIAFTDWREHPETNVLGLDRILTREHPDIGVEVIRTRMVELARAGVKQKQLPVWAQEYLASHREEVQALVRQGRAGPTRTREPSPTPIGEGMSLLVARVSMVAKPP